MRFNDDSGLGYFFLGHPVHLSSCCVVVYSPTVI